jgi:copper ion binding protein
MRTLIKSLFTLGVATALPTLIHAGGEACATAAGTCPASAKAGACCPATGATATTTATPSVKDAKTMKVDYKVTGMTCGACETKLTTALKGIDGVADATACADSKKATLTFDPAKVKDEQVLAAVKKAGFKVEAETIAVKVDGMSCGACSDKVSKKLASVKGVSEQKVCHEAKEAVVTFDPAKVSRKDVLAAIDTTGFKVVQ